MRSECSENFKNTTDQMFTDIEKSEVISTEHVRAICVESKSWPVQNNKPNIPSCLNSIWNEWVTKYKNQFKVKEKDQLITKPKIVDLSLELGSMVLQANLGK